MGIKRKFNHSTVSKDVFSYELDYFNIDYRAIGTTDQQYKYPFNNYATETSAVSRQLFNGNIIGMSTSLSQFGLAHYRYRYDQLNRLKEKHSYKQEIYGLEQTFDFAESFINDANGNILLANRNASMASAGGLEMDNLNYQYENNTNRLNFVTDYMRASSHDHNIDGQPYQNYTYDMIGNLVADKQESITNINWSVYGKIRGIIKRNTTTGKETITQYGYDPSGNRTYKEVIRRDIGNYSQDIVDRTYYVRDAQGNTMATYSKHEEPGNTSSLKWAEQHVYGSSRLGVMNLNLDIPAQTTVPQVNQTLVDSLHTGQVVYELTNHLGNVMATISDKKLFSNIVIPQTGVAAFYYSEVLSQTDYYAFGQEIKERSYRISGGYRYGFNRKNNNGEIKGKGNQQDYGMRIYDPRLGRFLSVDPGNVYFDEELGINIIRDSDTSGVITNESPKDTLRNKKK